MFPSYRNQSVDLQSKSTEWFLYMGTLVVKGLINKKEIKINLKWKPLIKCYTSTNFRRRNNLIHESIKTLNKLANKT